MASRWRRRAGLRSTEYIVELGDVVFCHACQLGFDCQQAPRLALCVWPLTALDQEQKSNRAGGEARGRGGLGQRTMAMNHFLLARYPATQRSAPPVYAPPAPQVGNYTGRILHGA